jgi:hypothetical protein
MSKFDEVSPPGWSGTVKAMKKHKDIDNPFALAWSMKKKGDKPHYKPEPKDSSKSDKEPEKKEKYKEKKCKKCKMESFAEFLVRRELNEDKKWIQGAFDPEHKGYCTPMTKKTCTPRRKALAKRFKSGDIHAGQED